MEISEMVMASTGQETMARIVFCWEKGILFFPACRLSSRDWFRKYVIRRPARQSTIAFLGIRMVPRPPSPVRFS